MRLLVCGGRGYRGPVSRVLDEMDETEEISVLISGGASGADKLALAWALHHGREAEVFPADWGKYGKRAGPIRNQRMLDEGRPDLVLAFPGGHGTEDMVEKAERAGVPVRRYQDA